MNGLSPGQWVGAVRAVPPSRSSSPEHPHFEQHPEESHQNDRNQHVSMRMRFDNFLSHVIQVEFLFDTSIESQESLSTMSRKTVWSPPKYL